MSSILRCFVLCCFVAISFISLQAQLVVEGDTLYGNEWINYDQSYYKIKVADDGIYRIPTETLLTAGIPADVRGDQIQLWYMGEEQRIYVSTDGPMQPNDYIEFYGQRNRSQLDRYLYEDPERMLNPAFSLYSDTSAYFLTWQPGSNAMRLTTVENNLSGTLPSKEVAYLHREKVIRSDAAFLDAENGQGIALSTFEQAEGFATRGIEDAMFNLAADHVTDVDHIPIHLRFRLTGNSPRHDIDINWNNRLLTKLGFSGTALIDSTIMLSAGDVKAKNVLNAREQGSGAKMNISTIELSYPHAFDFADRASAQLELIDVRDGAYLELENFAGQAPPIVYDLNGNHRLVASREEAVVRIHLPSGPVNRQVLVVDIDLALQIVNKIEEVDFQDLSNSDASYVIISHQALRNDGKGQDWVQNYAEYRQSTLGGNHNTQIITIDQLVNQFAYGVHLHPYSVKNFTNFIYKYWSNPQFIFLIGKGVNYARARNDRLTYTYLPVFGSPGSDNVMTSRGRSSTPLIPVGRIAVRHASQIASYLAKVKKLEEQIANAPRTLADRGWMKRGIHLAGGNGPGERNSILSSLDRMSTIVAEDSLGIKVSTFEIASNDVLDGSANEDAQALVDDGVLIKSYFGHGGINLTQFQIIEDPFFLKNQDRYPFMFALGCNTGNIFVSDVSLSESNVLIPDKGAIAYIATSGLGVLFALDDFGSTLYRFMGERFYRKPVGKAFQSTIRSKDGSINSSVKALTHQLTFHGDPAIVLSRDRFPDYVLDPASVVFDPSIIDRALDSFAVTFNLVNIGNNQGDSVTLRISHRTPTNIILPPQTTTVHATTSCQQVSINLPTPDSINLIGANRLLVEIDPESALVEEPGGKSNNQLQSNDGTLGIPFIIAESGIQPLFPPAYAISNKKEISMVAQTLDPIEPPGDYIFQIDTTATYDSPLLVSETLTHRSGIISWSPSVQALPNTVYYWRARRAQSDTIVWMQSSFTFAPDERTGFDQRHYYQFLDNELQGLLFDSVSRQSLFEPSFNDFELKIQAKSGGLGGGGFVNGRRWSDFYRGDISQGITFVVNYPLDSFGFVFNPNPGLYNSVNKRASPIAAFPFPTNTPEQRKYITDFIEDQIPEGAVAFAYTTQANPDLQLNIDDWQADSLAFGKNLFNVFEEMGATKIRSLATGGMRPYLLVFRKGKGVIDEILSSAPEDTIQYRFAIQKASIRGSMKSVRIGPAANWGELETDILLSTGDVTSTTIYGEGLAGSSTLLETVSGGNLQFDLSSIDATQYPYLRLQTLMTDYTNHDAADFNHWTVFYEHLPDLAFDFDGSLFSSCDTILGQSQLSLTIPISNYSPQHWPDSFDLQLSISDGTNQEISKIFRVPPVESGATVSIPINLSIEELTGQLLLTAIINPDGLEKEQYAQNNTLAKCYVRPDDDLAPILEVLFGGKRIMDGELIAAQPDILISLNDENTTSLLVDSALFDIYYIDPMGERVQVDFYAPEITFTPATDSNNIATVRYEPTFDKEGDYQFFVNARDNNNNKAGESAYNVHFKISNEQSLGDLLPYPNPFTTHCRFLYTVHGSIIPESISIRIYTLSGHVVKEITPGEIGPLQVGSNLTDYVWDGTDNYGDKLANGVYLYKVISESDIKNKQTAGAFFEKGLGKLTILR
ncbi:MAG: hypothetical protein HKN87_05455 [Saprospiraceae bacterium]|nr:hypothetical protein [Saprospiraceae bacterium]